VVLHEVSETEAAVTRPRYAPVGLSSLNSVAFASTWIVHPSLFNQRVCGITLRKLFSEEGSSDG